MLYFQLVKVEYISEYVGIQKARYMNRVLLRSKQGRPFDMKRIRNLIINKNNKIIQ